MLFLPKQLNPSLPNKQTVQPILKSSDRFRAVTAFFVFPLFACITGRITTLRVGCGRSCESFLFFRNGYPLSLLRNLFLFSYFVGSNILSMVNGY